MKKMTKEEKQKIYSLLESDVVGVTIHYDSGIDLKMSKMAFDKLQLK